MNILNYSGALVPNLNFLQKTRIPFLGGKGGMEIYIKHEKIPITYCWMKEKLQSSMVSFM